MQDMVAHFWICDANGEASTPFNEKMVRNDGQERIGFINHKFLLLYKEISIGNQSSKVKFHQSSI
jgi:hypothetical protein